MNWPTWTEVLTVLSLLVGTFATLLAGVKTLGWLVYPWMEKSAKAAMKDLHAQLKDNDFKHVEDRLDQVGSRLDRMENRIDARLTRTENRLLSAIQSINA